MWNHREREGGRETGKELAGSCRKACSRRGTPRNSSIFAGGEGVVTKGGARCGMTCYWVCGEGHWVLASTTDWRAGGLECGHQNTGV